MKKLMSIVLCIAILFSVSVVAFAAESPSATVKVTVTLRKATSVAPTEKTDVTYTIDNGTVVNVKANDAYGKFNNWSIYKVTSTVEPTSAKPASGVTTLSVAANVVALANAGSVVEAVAGKDYEIVSGSLTTSEMTVKVYSDVIICGNYDNVKTDPLVAGDKAQTSPQTGDINMVAVFAMLIGAAAVFGVKKAYNK